MTLGTPDWSQIGAIIDAPVEVLSTNITLAPGASYASLAIDMRRYASYTVNVSSTTGGAFATILRQVVVTWAGYSMNSARDSYNITTRTGYLMVTNQTKGGFIQIALSAAATAVNDSYLIRVTGYLTSKAASCLIGTATNVSGTMTENGESKYSTMFATVPAGASVTDYPITWPGDATIVLAKNFNFTTAGSFVRARVKDASFSTWPLGSVDISAAGDVTNQAPILIPNSQVLMQLVNTDTVAHNFGMSLVMKQ